MSSDDTTPPVAHGDLEPLHCNNKKPKHTTLEGEQAENMEIEVEEIQS